jgi:hypothetical protein
LSPCTRASSPEGAAENFIRDTRASSLIDQIRPLVKDGGLAHEARMSLRADIERIKEALAGEQWQPGAGPIPG